MINIARQHRAFSLIEVLMSIFILGIGVIAIASLLPAGIKQQQNAKNDAYGPVVADSALATLRSRLSPADFGGDDQLRDTSAPDELRSSVLNFFQYLPTGDFEWTRPSWWYGEASGNPSPLIPPSLRRGAVHPFIGPIGLPSFDTFWTEGAVAGFGLNFTGVPAGVAGSVNLLANPSVFPRYLPSSPFDGTPPGVFDYQVDDQDPAANIDLHYFVSREDRSWPQDSDSPEYYWDCAFQRSNGTVQVAIFVYRATEPDGKRLLDRPTDILSVGAAARSPDLLSDHMPSIWTSPGCRDSALFKLPPGHRPPLIPQAQVMSTSIVSGRPVASGSLMSTAMCTVSFAGATPPTNSWSNCTNQFQLSDAPRRTPQRFGTTTQTFLGSETPPTPTGQCFPPCLLSRLAL